MSLRERCQAFATRMPEGGAFSHGTAALLHGLQVPLRIENERRLHVSVPEVRRAVDAKGVVGHQLRLGPADIDLRFGMLVTTPERTWCDLAATLELAELVALGDREIFDTHGRFVARVDLAYPAVMIALEYEGDHHRTDKAQWRRDIARIRRLEALGWRVIRFTQDDIDDPREVIAQLRG